MRDYFFSLRENKVFTFIPGFETRGFPAHFDKVLYQGRECFVWGRRTSGSFLLRTIDGAKVKDGVGYRNLTLLERSTNYLIA